MKKPCPTCKNASLKQGTATHEVTVGKVRFTGTLSADVCTRCDEALVWAEELVRFELAASEQLVKLGLRTGPALKFLRKALGLRAVDLAADIGIAAETLSRWENGTPEPLVFAVLGAMLRERATGSTATLEHLRAMRSPARVKHVALDLPPRSTRDAAA